MRLATMFKNMGFTGNWQARCPGCKSIVNLADLGIKRAAPHGMTKRSFGWCRTCGALRLFHLEPIPPHAAD